MKERQIVRAGRNYVVLESNSAGESAPRALALHGFLDHGGSFGPLAGEVPALNWIAPDLPGHGASAHVGEGRHYPFLDYTWDAVNLLDALEWPTATLVGHSMGGGIAALVAAALPERVERLVLLDSPGPISGDADKTATQLGLGLRKLSAPPRDRRRVFASVEAAREALMTQTTVSARVADVILPRSIEPTKGGWRWRADPRLRTPSLARLTEDQIGAALAAITCPVLLISAKQSSLGPRFHAMFERRAPMINNLVHVELDAGHHVHIDAVKACADAIRSFVKG